MKTYVTTKPIPFTPVGTEFEYDDIGNLYFVDTKNNNIINFTTEEMEQMEAEGWVTSVDGRWKPKKGEVYWIIDETNENGIRIQESDDDSYDEARYNNYNVFQTKEEALEAAKAVKETLRTFHERRDK